MKQRWKLRWEYIYQDDDILYWKEYKWKTLDELIENINKWIEEEQREMTRKEIDRAIELNNMYEQY